MQNRAFRGKTRRNKTMIKILFICHGNICRSPMAEFVMKDLVARAGAAEQFYIASAATSTEELGNPVHYGTVRKLRAYGISTEGKYSVQLRKKSWEAIPSIRFAACWTFRSIQETLQIHGIPEILTKPMKTSKRAVKPSCKTAGCAYRA